MAITKKVRIGDLLIANGVISQTQLEQALDAQKKTGQRIGRTLVELGYVSEEQLLKLLSQQLGIPYIVLSNYPFNQEITQRLPETLARRFRSIVLAEESGQLLVGMVDPMDLFVCDELARVLGMPVTQAVVKEAELLATLDVVYRRTKEISQIASELSGELGDDSLEALQMETDTAEDAPVVKLLQTLFEDAVQVGTSDIHIEPDETVLRIRQRIDGVLHEHVMNERRIANAVVLRLKLMSGLDISEKRLPQDGRFNITVKGRKVDVRISTMPTQHGESVVMRLLDQSGGAIDLDSVGMPADILRRFRAQIRAPHGLVLVTGPTGSGKTTSLYGALKELNVSEKKIITVEDPVEYQLPRISQVQVNEKIGLNFARVLKATLRQDPDILLLGEIRDQETAEIALRASMTGHLVLSTLHTNDATSSTLRLIDIGLEGYSVSGALRAVIAQRLVRRICASCAQPHQPDANEKAWLSGFLRGREIPLTFKKGAGCTQCNQSGYKGRIGVFEYLEVDQVLADALRREDIEDFTRKAMLQKGFKPLAECALDYAIQGMTSLDEVRRVSEHVADVVDEQLQEAATESE